MVDRVVFVQLMVIEGLSGLQKRKQSTINGSIGFAPAKFTEHQKQMAGALKIGLHGKRVGR